MSPDLASLPGLGGFDRFLETRAVVVLRVVMRLPIALPGVEGQFRAVQPLRVYEHRDIALLAVVDAPALVGVVQTVEIGGGGEVRAPFVSGCCHSCSPRVVPADAGSPALAV